MFDLELVLLHALDAVLLEATLLFFDGVEVEEFSFALLILLIKKILIFLMSPSHPPLCGLHSPHIGIHLLERVKTDLPTGSTVFC